MAVGRPHDGVVQDQIDAGVEDAVKRSRSRLSEGEGLTPCKQCDAPIPDARRKAASGVHLCFKSLLAGGAEGSEPTIEMLCERQAAAFRR